MKTSVRVGDRLIINGNTNTYALAIVDDVVFLQRENRYKFVLRWPNAPGGVSHSHVFDHDEGSVWYKYTTTN